VTTDDLRAVAQGYASLGQIGFSERSGYTAIGTVCNVAAPLCGEAKDRQILLSRRVNVALKGSVATEQVGALVAHGQPTGSPRYRWGQSLNGQSAGWSPFMALRVIWLPRSNSVAFGAKTDINASGSQRRICECTP
jgi:hypothetical protein